MTTIWPLTEKEQQVLRYLESFVQKKGTAPTYRQIQEHFGFKSINSIQKYLRQLEQKGYIDLGGAYKKRSLVLLQSSDAFRQQYEEPPSFRSLEGGALELPLLGSVAAGVPLERVTHNEFMEVPRSLVRRPEHSFVLKVEGDSMIDDGIFDGDALIVQEQSLAANGQIVVAVAADQEATVKRFYLHRPQDLQQKNQDPSKPIELRPSNTAMSSFWYAPDQVEIRGIVVGLIRSF